MPRLTRKQKNRLFKHVKKQLKSGRIDGLLETFGKKTKSSPKAHKKLQYFIDKKESR